MRRTKNYLLLLLVSMTLPKQAAAWGEKGHNIVAEIAFSLLDQTTRDAVSQRLGTTTIEKASTWMDEMRSDHSYDYMKPWHYVNIAKGSDYTATTDDNIINALNNTISKLKKDHSTDNEDVKKEIMVLFHLVGDFHQPLHVGYATDKGGNTVKVKYLDREANLHWVWDSEIIKTEGITLENCMQVMARMKKEDIARLKDTKIEKWVAEPRALLGNVYDFQNNVIDQSYADKNKPVIEKQVVVAGIRLAAVLEYVLKP